METALQRQALAHRQAIVLAAANTGDEGVREFARALLLSQGRLLVHAVLLREYAARLACELRVRLNTSEVFRMEPRIPWPQDPISQKVIQTCEEIIYEQKRIEEYGQSDQVLAARINDSPKAWSPIVLEWEALKSTRKYDLNIEERIPESDLRSILAGERGTNPEDVTWEDIDKSAFELCHHYDRVIVIPTRTTELISRTNTPQYANAVADPAFWKEREDEFRKHDNGQNTAL